MSRSKVAVEEKLDRIERSVWLVNAPSSTGNFRRSGLSFSVPMLLENRRPTRMSICSS